MQRIGSQGMLEVGENQFLMLLFMIQTQDHPRGDILAVPGQRRPEKRGYVLVNVRPVAVDFRHARPR